MQIRRDDVVILYVGAQDASHSCSPSIPSKSPFLIKMETFLRMNDIAYERVSKDEDEENENFSQNNNIKGATPAASSSWVSFNGAKITDSEVAIEMLSKAFRVEEKLGFSAEQVRQTDNERSHLRLFLPIV